MSASTKPKALAIAAGICCLSVAYALAQPGQPGQPGRIDPPGQPGRIDQQTQPAQPPTISQQRTTTQTTQSQQPGVRGASQEVEQYLLNCLLEKNQAEVEIAQFGQQRAQNPEVKQFAAQLVQDHQQTIQKIQQLTGAQANAGRPQGVQQAGFEAQPGTSQPSTTAGGTQYSGTSGRTTSSTAAAGSQNPALVQLASIEKQIAEKCQANLREKLQSKQGAEFDHCFVGSQIAGHMHMLAALEVLQNQPGELGQLARDSQPKVKHHLEAAEQLAEKLMASSPPRQADAQQPQRVPR